MPDAIRSGWTKLISNLALCALACAACSEPVIGQDDGRQSRRERETATSTTTTATTGEQVGVVTASGTASSQQPSRSNSDAVTIDTGKTQLWLFGTIKSPHFVDPFKATGVRVIVDMRKLQAKPAIQILQQYADRNLGVGVCFRWRNPATVDGEVAKGRENYDIPPTPEEAQKALRQIRQIVTSEPARQLGDNFYVQFYNEIGGGPGYFEPKDVDDMFAFSTRATKAVREANPRAKIVGPAVTGSQMHLESKPLNNQRLRDKAEVIRAAIKWSAENADFIDIHLHASDGSWVTKSLQVLREQLNEYGGNNTRMVSFEWSCARYPERDNARGVRKAIIQIWNAMEAYDFEVAAYGPYWPLMNKQNAAIQDRFGWASVVDSKGNPNPMVYNTLAEIGKAVHSDR